MFQRLTKKQKKVPSLKKLVGTYFRETLHSETFVVANVLKKDNFGDILEKESDGNFSELELVCIC